MVKPTEEKISFSLVFLLGQPRIFILKVEIIYITNLFMAKSKIQKQTDLTELALRLNQAKGTVLVDYRGTKVKDLNKFRRAMEKESVVTKVYKVSLLKKALQDKQINVSPINYKAPVVLAMSNEEEALPAKLVKGLSKEIKTLNILSGIIDNKLISQQDVLALADLPGKQEMRARLAATINAPVSGFVNVLAGNIRGLLNVLNAISAK